MHREEACTGRSGNKENSGLNFRVIKNVLALGFIGLEMESDIFERVRTHYNSTSCIGSLPFHPREDKRDRISHGRKLQATYSRGGKFCFFRLLVSSWYSHSSSFKCTLPFLAETYLQECM